jgi:CheY-like chemotaxis protein
MAPVLVVEYDDGVRNVLHDLLMDAGYKVIAPTTDVVALDFLAASPDGVVVLCSNKDADHHLTAAFFARVVAEERVAPRHRYLLLSSHPLLIPPELLTHLAQLNAAILPKPFDAYILEASVREAATRLAPAHTPIPATE